MTALPTDPPAVGEEPAWAAQLTPEPSTRIQAAPATLTGLAVASLLGALVIGHVALVALAAPLAVAALAGLTRAVPDVQQVRLSVDRLATVEGQPITVGVQVASSRSVGRVELVLDVDGALAGPAIGRAVSVTAAGTTATELAVPCPRWGVGRIGAVVLRWRDPAGVVTRTARCELGAVVRVLPAAQTMRTLVRTEETQLAAGNVVARELGQGLEFGEVRAYTPGDRLRSINWRVSARRDGLWVTDHHIERNVDVVIAVDAVLPTALVPAVRAAAALADAYLGERDRVGLIGMGGRLRWLRPGGGATQRHRLIDELIAAQAFATEVWGTGLEVPRQTLPPGALVVALTSLLDDHAAGTLLNLRDRGFAMAVIEVDAPLPPPERDAAVHLADRLWRLARDARRDRLRARGVPVARWQEHEPLEAAMAAIAAFRRALRRPVT